LSLIRLQIGDRSIYGQSRDYYVLSAKPVQDVREAHFKAMGEIFDLTQVCNTYRENTLALDKCPDWLLESFGYEKGEDLSHEEAVLFGPAEFADLWVELLNRADPELELQFVQFQDLLQPRQDEKGRSYTNMGYGLFS